MKGIYFMADQKFISADLTKLADFETKSASAVKEFDAIKEKFGNINETLLSAWEGVGADAYKYETDNILEKIGNVKDVLDAINDAVKDIRTNYSKFDDEMGEFNKNPNSKEEE